MSEKQVLSDAVLDGIDAGDFTALRKLIHVLRSEQGCPWDKVQTFESLRTCMLDEQVEVFAGIDLYQQTGDAANLCEELGDVLLNLLLYADLAEAKGLFNVEDLIRVIGHKMLRRHPHVFEEKSRRGWDPKLLGESEALPRTWKEIKQVEKAQTPPEQILKQKEAAGKAAAWAGEQLRKIEDEARQAAGNP